MSPPPHSRLGLFQIKMLPNPEPRYSRFGVEGNQPALYGERWWSCLHRTACKHSCRLWRGLKWSLPSPKPHTLNCDTNPKRAQFSAHPIVERLPPESSGHGGIMDQQLEGSAPWCDLWCLRSLCQIIVQFTQHLVLAGFPWHGLELS